VPTDDAYDELIGAATAAPIGGWSFGWLDGRVSGSDPSWSYPDLARRLLPGCHCVLDVDTGGGELLASLAPLPRHTWATESWPANVPVARARLQPLGVTVVPATERAAGLPVADQKFDLLLNRHGHLDAAEAARVLEPGGTLLTQQVGSDDCAELNAALGAPAAHEPGSWNLATAAQALTAAGFELDDSRQEWPILAFYDVGAVVYHLRMVSWQVPEFTVDRYDGALRRLHARIRTAGRLDIHAHRFLISATLAP